MPVSGTVHTISDPNNYLSQVGWNSLAIGQSFNASFTQSISPTVAASFPGASGGTSYETNDVLASASIEIIGSGAGSLPTSPFIGASGLVDATVSVLDNFDGVLFIDSDVYSYTRLLSAGAEVLFISIILEDSSETRLSNENFFVETDKSTWNAEGFVVFRVASPGVFEVLLVGSSGPSSGVSPISVSGSVLSVTDPSGHLDSVGWNGVAPGDPFSGQFQIGSPVVTDSVPALAGGTAYVANDLSSASSITIGGTPVGEVTTSPFSGIGFGLVMRDNLPGDFTAQADRFAVARQLPSSTGEVLVLNLYLEDTTQTKLVDEQYRLISSKSGWDVEGFSVTRLIPPTFDTLETLMYGGSTGVSGFPLVSTGTVQSIDGPDDVLGQLGMNTVSETQIFTSSYTMGASAPTPLVTLPDGGELYGVIDAALDASFSIAGSGATSIATQNLASGDNALVAIANNVPTSLSASSDYYSVIRALPVAGVTYHQFFLDPTGSKLNQQGFYIEDSAQGWPIEGFVIFQNVGTATERIVMVASNEQTTTAVQAGGVKGPTVGATIGLYDFDIVSGEIVLGNKISTGTITTGANAQADLTIPPFVSPPPYALVVENGTDMTTNTSPVVSQIKTIVTQEMLDSGEQIWASVLTTLASDVAAARSTDADDLLSELPLSAAQVLDVVGFGASTDIDIFSTPPTLSPGNDTQQEQADAFAHRLANEVVAQLLDNLGDANAQLATLASDLAVDSDIDDTAIQTAVLDVGTTGAENFMVPDPENPGQMVALSQAIETALVSEVDTLQEPASVDTAFVETQDLFTSTFTAPSSVAELAADSDGDGTPDSVDDFPLDAGADSAGGPSADDDGDGVINSMDDAPQDPLIQTDADEDNIDDSVDLDINTNFFIADSDGDGTTDALDAFPANVAESADSDGDGVGDNADAFPNDPLATSDTDSDTVADGVDNCLATSNSDQLDTDSDQQGNVCDADDDNDGFTDVEELEAGSDPLDANSTPTTNVSVPVPLWVLLVLSALMIVVRRMSVGATHL